MISLQVISHAPISFSYNKEGHPIFEKADLSHAELRITFSGHDFLKEEKVRDLFGWSEDTVTSFKQTGIDYPFKWTVFRSLEGKVSVFNIIEDSRIKRARGRSISQLSLYDLTGINVESLELRLKEYHASKRKIGESPDLISGLERAIEVIEANKAA